MINERLFQYYQIDTTKDLRILNRCPRPYDTILIDKRGSCYACECQSWLPQSIGNLQVKTLQEIIGGDMRKHLQRSVTDGTYRYCNEHQCTYIKSNTVLDGDSDRVTDQIKWLRLAIDDSCNLRCPSCRDRLIFHKQGSAYNLGIRLADKINDWLHEQTGTIRVHIGSDGDPFASHVYRHFMEHTPSKDGITYSILTNGLMLPEFRHRIPHVITNLHELSISIDGGTKETYERLRLGGRWDKIQESLACVSDLRQQHGFPVRLHMVVQDANWREMPEMLEIGQRVGADRVYLNGIQDWNTDLDVASQTFRTEPEFVQLVEQISGHPLAFTNGLL